MEPSHGDAGELVGSAVNKGGDLVRTALARRPGRRSSPAGTRRRAGARIAGRGGAREGDRAAARGRGRGPGNGGGAAPARSGGGGESPGGGAALGNQGAGPG